MQLTILIIKNMKHQANQKRIQRIFQMLFEMSIGNFAYRIPVDEIEDQISVIYKDLNKIAEKILTFINESGYLIPVYTYQSLVQATFLLNKEFQIESYSNNLPEMLGYPPNTLFNCQFYHIIATHSKKTVRLIQTSACKEADYFTTLQVTFLGANGKLIPHFCTFSRLRHCDQIIVNVIATTVHDYIDYYTPTSLTARPKSAAVIQLLHNYILTHLDAPLPTIKELAKMFGSNTFTLKDGFRYYFNTSIHHFYNEQRLKKAHYLLQQTTHAVKAIAYMTGFNDYPTFYKAFKKQYGYAPSDLYRQKNDEKEP